MYHKDNFNMKIFQPLELTIT